MVAMGIFELMFIGLVISIPLILIVLAVSIVRLGGRTTSTEETQLVQELLQGLKRLEERVNSLETILLERRGKD